MHFLSFLIIFNLYNGVPALVSPPQPTDSLELEPQQLSLLAKASAVDDQISILSTCPDSETCTGQTITWSGQAGPFPCTSSTNPSLCTAVLPQGGPTLVAESDSLASVQCGNGGTGLCIDTAILNFTKSISPHASSLALATQTGSQRNSTFTRTASASTVGCTGQNMINGEACGEISVGRPLKANLLSVLLISLLGGVWVC